MKTIGYILALILALTVTSAHGYQDYDTEEYLDRQEETYRMIREQAQEPEKPCPYKILIGEKVVL